MDFYLYLHVSEGVPVRKKDEILVRAGFIVFPRSSLGTFILCASTRPVAPVAQRYHVTSDTLGREFDPGKHDFSH